MMQSTSEFVLEQIRMRPDVTLEDLRARAALEGRRVRAATFYRARVDLGLDGGAAPAPSDHAAVPGVEAAAESPATSAEEGAASPKPAASESSRRRPDDGSLSHLTEAVKGFFEERNRLREALTRMRQIVQEVLER